MATKNGSRERTRYRDCTRVWSSAYRSASAYDRKSRRQCFSVIIIVFFSFIAVKMKHKWIKQLNMECFQLDHAVFMTICYNTPLCVCSFLKECPNYMWFIDFTLFSDEKKYRRRLRLFFLVRILVIRFFILARYKLMVFYRFVIYWCCIVL